MHEPALGFGVEMNALNQCLDLVRKDSGRIGMRPLADRLCSCFADLLQPGAIVPETFKRTANTAGRGGFGQEAGCIVSHDFTVAGNIGRQLRAFRTAWPQRQAADLQHATAIQGHDAHARYPRQRDDGRQRSFCGRSSALRRGAGAYRVMAPRHKVRDANRAPAIAVRLAPRTEGLAP